MEQGLAAVWRTRRGLACLLLIPAGLFLVLATLRRSLYRSGLLRGDRLSVPVVMVGNIIAGGAGKTPLTLHLARMLKMAGRRPGIVSRGHGGAGQVMEVGADSAPAAVGDEPLLLRSRASCPVFVGRKRATAARALLAAYPETDVILCDDGLQHYALARDIEIAVFDRRGLMNGWPLPAGPLREMPARLREVDAVVFNGDPAGIPRHPHVFHMTLMGDRFHLLGDPSRHFTAADLAGMKLHAVAGISDPGRFFDHLASLGLTPECHPFPDHHPYVAADIAFTGDAILATEKDAVKLHGLALLPVWVLPVDACLSPDLARFVLEKLDGPPSA
ncbi:MAG: tetraacyldisaccharide 4'-kinase [Proteobacteria bacterium]|nr:tetraacyldisaccharide 4'-kinase [Pseudomonadota bacterium]